MTARVSTVVTSYNHGEYLDQRLQSLLDQTCQPLEIIVVDDNSTDDSVLVLEKYREVPNVKIITLDANGGYANACNLGVSLSQGEFVMFAECDDFSEPKHIETLVEPMIQNGDIGVSYCRSNMVNESGRILGTDFDCRSTTFRMQCNEDAVISSHQMRKHLLLSCVIPNMSAALIRRSVLDQVGGLSDAYRACADWDFWCRIAKHSDFYYVSLPLNNFRMHATTVRRTSGIKLPVAEIYRLLYTAVKEEHLSVWEGLRFRTNVGAIWAEYVRLNPMGWAKDFLPVWRCSVDYDKLSLLWLMLGSCSRASSALGNYFERICKK